MNNIIDFKTGKPVASDKEVLELLKFLATPTQQAHTPPWYRGERFHRFLIITPIVFSSVGLGWCLHAIFGK